jgi:CRISPR-associated endonuclease/helicase Cas3
MSDLPSFGNFFQALWGFGPFPWQEMLAERAASGHWPDAIDLPMASGKTACLDIAVYALASQAGRAISERTTARRVWFVVDRRIVVDEAFDRAERLAKKLDDENAPRAIRAIAERLLDLRGLPYRKRPLAVGRLRGGVLRDDRWARIPSQAAIITSTVDQLGSRLLFRGYGPSALAAPVFAGLAGNDSLILLDEAHCAVPFLQTLRAVKLFRAPKWSEVANQTPFHVSVLSATPPGEDDGEKSVVFPASPDERQKALNHETLQLRLTASKLAVLETVKDEDTLAGKIAEAAEKLARGGTQRIGVIVNRVARAAQIAEILGSRSREKVPTGEPPAYDVELLTGGIRSVERDTLVVEKLHPVLHSSPERNPERPLILVSTQCLEVGADFSFETLVTECASLDALRQRFGRLARLGKPTTSHAFIFFAETAIKDSDPIYGDALKATWEFLWDKATIELGDKGKETRSVDFGFEALRALFSEVAEPEKLLAPSSDAPILLPAHLDLLCQTSPRPYPDPDIGIFLHGKGRSAAEVRVAFRCDLDPEHPDDWAEIVSLCPPVAGEMFSAPLHRFRAWLEDRESSDTTGDVEGAFDESEPSDSTRSRPRQFLLYRGREKSRVSDSPTEIFPDVIVILPAPRDEAGVSKVRKLGQALCDRGFGAQKLDVWELATQKAGKTPALRIHRECLAPWLGERGCPPLRVLVELVENGAWTADELRNALSTVVEWKPENDATSELPEWLRNLFEEVARFRFPDDIATYPNGSIILQAKPKKTATAEPDFFADDDDSHSTAPREVKLAEHCIQVAEVAEQLARACLGEYAAPLAKTAGQWHDSGKLDLRFQDILRGGAPDDGSEPLAKSPRKPRSREQAKAVAEAARLPENFRHEMLSAQLANLFIGPSLSAEDRELLLHLIASHHGHGRPFAPVCEDAEPPALKAQFARVSIEVADEQRRLLIPPHRLDSGVTDRFWTLIRRVGWWGLAYYEAILRLADWYASERPASSSEPPRHE